MPTEADVIRSRLKRVKTLRTLPGVVRKLCLLVEAEHMSSQEIARMISKDQVMTARLLRLVNSSFYGFPNRISTVTQALVILGFSVVKGLMLSASIVDAMRASMTGLWEHSLGCSMAAGMIARKIGEKDPEEAQVAGLLHDLGKVVVATDFEKEYAEILELIDSKGLSFYEAEKQVLSGISHIEIADFLCEEWNIPKALREAIRCHHHPGRATYNPRGAAIVHLADALIRAAGFGNGGDSMVPAIEEKIVRDLGLDDAMLKEIIDAMLYELENVDVSDLMEE